MEFEDDDSFAEIIVTSCTDSQFFCSPLEPLVIALSLEIDLLSCGSQTQMENKNLVVSALVHQFYK